MSSALVQWRQFAFFDASALPAESEGQTLPRFIEVGFPHGARLCVCVSHHVHVMTAAHSHSPTHPPTGQALEVIACCAGRGNLILGDALGFVHLVDRSLQVASFPAYEKSVVHLFQWKQRNYLLSVGYDDESFPIVKVRPSVGLLGVVDGVCLSLVLNHVLFRYYYYHHRYYYYCAQ